MLRSTARLIPFTVALQIVALSAVSANETEIQGTPVTCEGKFVVSEADEAVVDTVTGVDRSTGLQDGEASLLDGEFAVTERRLAEAFDGDAAHPSHVTGRHRGTRTLAKAGNTIDIQGRVAIRRIGNIRRRVNDLGGRRARKPPSDLVRAKGLVAGVGRPGQRCGGLQ